MGQTHKTITEGAVRIKAVQLYLDRGYSPAVIAKMAHPANPRRQLGSVKTILADIKKIRATRMAADPDYFERARGAISEATSNYKRVMQDMELAIEAARHVDEPNHHAINSMLMQKAKVTELWLEANILYDPDKLLTEVIGEYMYAAIKQVQKTNGLDPRGGRAKGGKPARLALPGTTDRG